MEGFVDATGLIRCGVYLLMRRGAVVFVGKAEKSMLAKIAAHRALCRKTTPAWLPVRGISFDQILIKTVHPDRLEIEYNNLVDQFNPHYNLPPPAFIPTETPIVRRV